MASMHGFGWAAILLVAQGGAAPPQGPRPAPARPPSASAPASAPAVGPRSAVAFGFGGRVGPGEEGHVAGLESPRPRDGRGAGGGATVDAADAWGDAGPDGDFGRFPGGPARCSGVLADKDGASVVYSIAPAPASASGWVVANFRYTLRDGRRGIATAVIPRGAGGKPPREGVAVLGFGGRLAPRDEGYVPGFESCKLRLGPGDWAGAKVAAVASWGEGPADGGTPRAWAGDDARTSAVRRDAGGAYVVHSVRASGSSRWVAAAFRLGRADGRRAVATALYPFAGGLAPPRPVGQPADFPVAPARPAPTRPAPGARALAAARPTPADLAYLRSLDDRFAGMELDDLAALTTLDLAGKPIDDEGATHLRGLKQLRELNLRGTWVGDAGLANLAGLTNLRQLNLIATPTTDAGLEVVGRLGGLVTLGLDLTSVTDAGFRSLRGLKRLDTLSFAGADVGDAGLAELRALPALREVGMGRDRAVVGGDVTAAGLAALKACPKLRKLDLAGAKLGDDGLAALKGARLTWLHLGKSDVTDAGLAHLKGLPDLEVLYLRETPLAGPGLAQLAGLPRLRQLSLAFTPLGDAGLAHLAGVTGLVDLEVIQGNITDAGLAHLKGLTRLERLDLPDNEVAGPGLVHLKGLNRLARLNLYANKLDDAALARIRQFPGLAELYVSGDGITDAGLAQIKGLARLGSISLSHTKVTRAGLDDLRRAFPDATIQHGDF